MDTKSKFLIKNIGILTVSNFASKILVFLLVPLYTSILSTEDYGIYDIVYSTIQLLFPILTLNISDAVMRFSMDNNKNLDEVAMVGFKILIRGCLPIIFFFVGCWKFEWIKVLKGYEFLILLFFIAYFLFQFLVQLSKGRERVLDMGIAGVISTAFLVGGNILLLLIFQFGLKGFYIANILSQGIPAAFLAFRLKIWKLSFWKKNNKSLEKEMIVYCLPLIASVLGWWINASSDRYTVIIMCGSSANGVLSVAYKIPSIINVIQGIFTQAWQISAIKEYESVDKAKFYGKYFKGLNSLMVLSGSLLIVFTKIIGSVMYSKEFIAACEYVPFLLIACVLNAASGFMGPILSAKKDSKAMALSAIYGATANIVLNIIFVYLIGIQGATIATVISSYIIYFIRKKHIGKEIEIEKYKTILITWALLCVQAVVELYTDFWYMELIILGILLWISRNELIRIIKKFLWRKKI